MKSIYVHMRNKFPGARVELSEGQVSAHCQSTGDVLMAAMKNGLGVVVDAKDHLGARMSLCLSPIPKDCRRVKLFAAGHVGPSEEFQERMAKSTEMVAKYGYVPSELQLEHSKGGELLSPEAALLKAKGGR